MVISKHRSPIAKSFIKGKNNEVKQINNLKKFKTNIFYDAGQFYLATTKAVLDETQAFSNYSSPLIIPRYRAVDIDTKEDFELAEKLFILNKRTS